MRIYLDNCCYNRPYDDQSQIRVSLETQAKLYTQERFDYTEWQRKYFDRMTPEEIQKEAAEYAMKNPYTGDRSKIL